MANRFYPKNKKIVAVFAHPDDESFGPGGTLAKLAEENQVFLLSATKGDAGRGIKRNIPLPKVRAEELKKAGKILGIKKIFFLGFKDGTLCNKLYHQLAKKITNKLNQIKPEMVITYEPRGVSGHLDHIAVSLTTSFAVSKLPFVKTILYYCLSKEQRKLIKDYFIFFPPGYSKKEINLVVDIASVWEKKVAAIQAHQSQRHDIESICKNLSLAKKECFIMKNLGKS